MSARRFASEALWNYVALGATALVGATVYLTIAGRMGAAALGVFAQAYALYVVGAQLAAFGVHDSVQKHVAAELDVAEQDSAGAAGAVVVLVIACVLGALLASLAGVIGRAADSPDFARAIYLVAPGVVLFALNKVLFAVLNGKGLLRRYAFGQIARALLVSGALAVLLGSSLPGWTAFGVLPAAELGLMPLLYGLSRLSLPRVHLGAWPRRHLSFGARAALNAVLLEVQLRVDVLVLSFFVSDQDVGVYAFAALFAEGLHQVAVVIRTVAYPELVRFAESADREKVSALARRLALTSGGICGVVAVVVLAGFPHLTAWFPLPLVARGYPVLMLLLAGIWFYSLFVPFDQILLQSGLPGRQSLLIGATVASNVVLNLLLIPSLSLIGAAMATTFSFLGAGIGLVVATSKWLGYRRGILFHRALR
jgi:O-antigen/teichoic acid export membrane protein